MKNYLPEIEALMKADKYPKAFELCALALRDNPRNEKVIELFSFIFQRIQDAHIDLEPKTAPEFSMRGIAYFYSGDFNSALNDLNKAIELDENHDYAWKTRSLIYFFSKEFQLAERDIRQAIEIFPCAEYYSDLGNVISQMNPNNYESIDCYLKAVELSEIKDAYLYNLGCDYAEKGKLLEAIKIFEEVLRINPKNEDAVHNLNHYKAQIHNLN